MLRSHLPLAAVASLGLLLPGLGLADSVSAGAAVSATVQPNGPRTGFNGTNFFNVGNNSSFVSFGVLDFNVSDFNLAFPATAVSNLSLALTEANATSTRPLGALNFYLVTDTVMSIANDGNSPLRFLAESSPEGLGTQLGATPFLLGTGNFSDSSGNVNSGRVDTYSLALGNDAQAYFLSQLNAGGAKLRLAVTATDLTGFSTWAGSTTNVAGGKPKLTFDATLDQPSLTWIGGSGTWNATGGTSWSGAAWDASKTAVFNAGSGGVTLGTPVTALGVKFDVTGYTISGDAANPLTLSSGTGGNAISVTNAADTATINAVIAGASGVQKNGSGKLILGGANTFTGTVTINSGVLEIGSDANLGAAANGIALNGGTLRAAVATTLGDGRTLSGSGTLDAPAGLIFSGPVNATALAFASGSAVTFAGSGIAFGSAALGAGSQLTVAAPLTGTGRISFTGNGTVALNGDNSAFGAGITMTGSGGVGPTVAINSAASLGTGQLRLNGGTLAATTALTGANAVTTSVSLGGSATLSGNMEITAFGFFGATAKRLTVTDSVLLSGGISSTGTANIGDALIKAGAGTLTLNTANSYLGGTQVLAGTLEVLAGGTLGLGDVTVAAEAAIAALLRLDAENSIDDLLNVFLVDSAGSSKIELNFDSSLFEMVNGLTINGTALAPGDYNAANLPDYLSGTGNLRVMPVPEPGAWALLLLGAGALGVMRWRARKTA